MEILKRVKCSKPQIAAAAAAAAVFRTNKPSGGLARGREKGGASEL